MSDGQTESSFSGALVATFFQEHDWELLILYGESQGSTESSGWNAGLEGVIYAKIPKCESRPCLYVQPWINDLLFKALSSTLKKMFKFWVHKDKVKGNYKAFIFLKKISLLCIFL